LVNTVMAAMSSSFSCDSNSSCAENKSNHFFAGIRHSGMTPVGSIAALLLCGNASRARCVAAGAPTAAFWISVTDVYPRGLNSASKMVDGFR